MSQITKATDPVFPVGTIVRVVDDGQGYSTYELMAKFVGLLCYTPARFLKYDQTYTVRGSAIHENVEYGEIVGIAGADGSEFLVGVSGLALVAPVSLAEQVAGIEAELETVTAERDALQAKLDAILNVVKGE